MYIPERKRSDENYDKAADETGNAEGTFSLLVSARVGGAGR